VVVRKSSIDDIEVTTAIVRELNQHLDGNVEIHYVTKTNYNSLLEHKSYITKVHTIEKNYSEVA